jgi:hypothetical protein
MPQSNISPTLPQLRRFAAVASKPLESFAAAVLAAVRRRFAVHTAKYLNFLDAAVRRRCGGGAARSPPIPLRDRAPVYGGAARQKDSLAVMPEFKRHWETRRHREAPEADGSTAWWCMHRV